MITPFHNQEGLIEFSWKPTSDRVFIYRLPTPKTFNPESSIIIPDVLKEHFQPSLGFVLAVGLGFYDQKGKFQVVSEEIKPGILVNFDPQVPWSMFMKGLDGKFHKVVICGVQDILGIVEES